MARAHPHKPPVEHLTSHHRNVLRAGARLADMVRLWSTIRTPRTEEAVLQALTMYDEAERAS